ncbi:MAG: UDP-N-acetylmuramate dehydrogenase [Candidatus Zixiibacteriota bacterium]
MKKLEQLTVNDSISKSMLAGIFGENLEFDKNLAPFTSFKTGGPAKYFYSAQTENDVIKTVKSAIQLKLPFFIIGGGSNLLISDTGYDGLIIKIDVRGLKMLSDTEIECNAGEDLMSLVDFATDNSLSGLEFASGIWGTVGGAIYGNAGAYGGEMKDIIKEITLVDSAGKIKTIKPDYCRFGYRNSYLKETGEIILKATFKLRIGDCNTIKNKVQEILDIRTEKHPTKGNSAGCFFKNIPDTKEKFGKLPAGKLLEQIGAKNMSFGGASVYDKHANMIVNTGTATSKDIRALADKLKEKVYKKFGIILEEEIIQVGKF